MPTSAVLALCLLMTFPSVRRAARSPRPLPANDARATPLHIQSASQLAIVDGVRHLSGRLFVRCDANAPLRQIASRAHATNRLFHRAFVARRQRVFHRKTRWRTLSASSVARREAEGVSGYVERRTTRPRAAGEVLSAAFFCGTPSQCVTASRPRCTSMLSAVGPRRNVSRSAVSTAAHNAKEEVVKIHCTRGR